MQKYNKTIHFSLSTFHFYKYLCTRNREIIQIFIRLVVLGSAFAAPVSFFKVKIMLLDFQSTLMLGCVVVATILSIITLVHTNVR